MVPSGKDPVPLVFLKAVDAKAVVFHNRFKLRGDRLENIHCIILFGTRQTRDEIDVRVRTGGPLIEPEHGSASEMWRVKAVNRTNKFILHVFDRLYHRYA